MSDTSFRKSSSLLPLAAFLSLPLSMYAGAPQGAAGSATPAARSSALHVSPTKSQGQPLLPPDFAGTPREGNIVIQPTPSDADAAHTAVLKEDGLVESTTAHYAGSGPGGWTLEVMRFRDATGAYGAFTFYRDPAMQPKTVGDNAAASAGVFLVQSSASLVIARATGLGLTGNAAHPGIDLGTAMQALVQGLPKLGGPEAVIPALPGLMPAEGLEKQTLHYTIGPAGYNGPLPVSAIDFGRDAEAAIARYHLHSGTTGTLTLIMLPTPQIAGATLRTIAALPDASLHVATRRTGPLVGIVSGAGVSQADAGRLLGQIRYVSDLTLDQPQGYTSEVAKAAKLLVGIAWLTAILALAALVIAVFLGAGRVLLRRLQGRPDSSLNDDEFISLKL